MADPIPAEPDLERRTRYSGVIASVGPFNVGFDLYGDATDYSNWIEVWVNGVKVTFTGNWTLDSPSGSLSALARPITDARITFTAAQTGTIDIVGARRPRRTSQFTENVGVTARNLNQVLTDYIMLAREFWDKFSRTLQAPPGEVLGLLPTATKRAGTVLAFDSQGQPSPQPIETTVLAIGEFATKAAVEAAFIQAGVSGIKTLGRAALGDGGGAQYLRTASEPTHKGKIQSADGSWWVYADKKVNARAFGAKGDAVQNPTTLAWSGTDDTTALYDWEQTADALSRERYLPTGAYIVKDSITRSDSVGLQNSSNVIISGDGPTSKIIIQALTPTQNGLWRYGGTTDGDNSVTVYLTSNAAIGDRQITVNDSSLLTKDQYVILIDHSQPIHTNQNLTQIANVGQRNRIKSIDDGTHVTLYGKLEYALVANAGTPLSGTTIRRYTSPIVNFTARDFNVEMDETVGSYTTTHRIFQVRRGVNVNFERVRTKKSQWYEFQISECIDYRVVDCTFDRGAYDATYTIDAPGSHDGFISKCKLFGGRHLTDAAPSSSDGVEASYTIVHQCEGFGTQAAPFNTHAGVRHWIFADCIAATGGLNSDTPTAPGNAGFQMRGRNMTIINPKTIGYLTGIYSAFGYDTRIIGGELEGCDVGIRTVLTDKFEARGVKIINPVTNAILIDDSTGMGAHLIRDIDIIGNPSGAAISASGTIGLDWRFERIRAPNATTKFSGITDEFAYGTIAKTANFTPVAGLPCLYRIDSSGGAITIAPASAASEKGNTYAFKKTNSGGGAITFDPNSTELVDGASTRVIQDGETIQVKSNGTGWDITSSFSGVAAHISAFLANPSTANFLAALTDEASGLGSLLTTPTVANLLAFLTDEASGLGSFLTSPSSANLAALLTDATGTGAAVFGTAPTISRSINTQTDNYTLVLSDAAAVVEMNKASALTLTIPLNATVTYPVGTMIPISQTGAGQLTVAITATGTLHSSGSLVKLFGQYSTAWLYKQATDTWLLSGDLA